jgi:hypothetical protein
MIAVARNFARNQLEAEHAGQFPEGHDEPQRQSSRRNSSALCGIVSCNFFRRTSVSLNGTTGMD